MNAGARVIVSAASFAVIFIAWEVVLGNWPMPTLGIPAAAVALAAWGVARLRQ